MTTVSIPAPVDVALVRQARDAIRRVDGVVFTEAHYDPASDQTEQLARQLEPDVREALRILNLVLGEAK